MFHSPKGPSGLKVFTDRIQSQHIKGVEHPSLLSLIQSSLSRSRPCARQAQVPTYSSMDCSTLKLHDFWRVTPEPFICNYCHPVCEVHNPLDLIRIFICVDSNLDPQHRTQPSYPFVHVLHTARLLVKFSHCSDVCLRTFTCKLECPLKN